MPQYADDENKRFFDSASVGIVSVEAHEASRIAEERSSVISWPETVDKVKAALAHHLDVPPCYLTLYHNTTAGFQRIFSRLRHLFANDYPTLLTTDLEYPGIMALADEDWMGRLVVVKVADLIWRGKAHLVEPTILRAVLATRPSVVCLSHIARASGFQVNSFLLRYIKTLDPTIVTIVDGAQAIGNIEIEPILLDYSDFYVGSGHKWLCGKQTLGLVYAHDSWHLDDPAQGYSVYSGSRGTGSSGALASLATSLEELNGTSNLEGERHTMAGIAGLNGSLARQFSAIVAEAGLRTVPALQERPNEWKWNGLIVISQLSPVARQTLEDIKACFQFSSLRAELWRLPSLGGDPSGPRFTLELTLDEANHTETMNFESDDHGETLPSVIRSRFTEVRISEEHSCVPPGGCTRFCFHFYHTTADIKALADAITGALKTDDFH